MAFTPQTVTILTQNTYGLGEHEGNHIAWPVGATNMQAIGTMSNTDLQTPGKTAQITLLESFDGDLTVGRGPSAPWASGVLEKDGVTFVPPNAAVGYNSNPPTHVSAIIAPNQPMSVGLQLNFT